MNKKRLNKVSAVFLSLLLAFSALTAIPVFAEESGTTAYGVFDPASDGCTCPPPGNVEEFAALLGYIIPEAVDRYAVRTLNVVRLEGIEGQVRSAILSFALDLGWEEVSEGLLSWFVDIVLWAVTEAGCGGNGYVPTPDDVYTYVGGRVLRNGEPVNGWVYISPEFIAAFDTNFTANDGRFFTDGVAARTRSQYVGAATWTHDGAHVIFCADALPKFGITAANRAAAAFLNFPDFNPPAGWIAWGDGTDYWPMFFDTTLDGGNFIVAATARVANLWYGYNHTAGAPDWAPETGWLDNRANLTFIFDANGAAENAYAESECPVPNGNGVTDHPQAAAAVAALNFLAADYPVTAAEVVAALADLVPPLVLTVADVTVNSPTDAEPGSIVVNPGAAYNNIVVVIPATGNGNGGPVSGVDMVVRGTQLNSAGHGAALIDAPFGWTPGSNWTMTFWIRGATPGRSGVMVQWSEYPASVCDPETWINCCPDNAAGAANSNCVGRPITYGEWVQVTVPVLVPPANGSQIQFNFDDGGPGDVFYIAEITFIDPAGNVTVVPNTAVSGHWGPAEFTVEIVTAP